MHRQHKLPLGYVLINKERHEQLNATMFNPAADGKESENRFSDKFNTEISNIMESCSEFLGRHGEFGSVDRYVEGLPSDWWINSDFFSVSRVLFIELLDSKMQSYAILEGLRELLFKLPSEWMLMVGHDHAYDNNAGESGEEAGSYYFWIRKEMVEVYSDRPEYLDAFYRSLDDNAV
jgi:hypothetical protein